jgi:hypothetical protein
MNKPTPLHDRGARILAAGCLLLAKIWHLIEFVRVVHNSIKDTVCIVLDERRVQSAQHELVKLARVLLNHRWENGVHSDDMYDWRQKLVHALSIAASFRVGFTVHKQNVENHALHVRLMVVGLVRQSLDILQNLGANNLVLTDSVPRRLSCISESRSSWMNETG